LHDALARLVGQGVIGAHPLIAFCAAVSVGVVDGTPVLDLPYVEDSRAEVDMNLVMTSEGRFVEVQGTAEGMAFTRAELDEMVALGEKGIAEIIELQQEMVAESPPLRRVVPDRK
jgi:ribonuclease PH